MHAADRPLGSAWGRARHPCREGARALPLCRGHASENPELPEALSQRGIRFLGPHAAAMAALGDKVCMCAKDNGLLCACLEAPLPACLGVPLSACLEAPLPACLGVPLPACLRVPSVVQALCGLCCLYSVPVFVTEFVSMQLPLSAGTSVCPMCRHRCLCHVLAGNSFLERVVAINKACLRSESTTLTGYLKDKRVQGPF